MTYCLGILIQEGLIMVSDSRTNAGIDQIATVRKQANFLDPDGRLITVLSAGNLGTTQSVVTTLKQSWGTGTDQDLKSVPTMFDATTLIAMVYRRILERDGDYVRPYGDPTASFLVGGQIKGETPRLFEIYAAGNFIEATPRTQFLQIGETKYGKPILDRALQLDTTMATAAKCALLSFDATIRSNLSVGPPIDLLCYRKDSYSVDSNRKFGPKDREWAEMSDTYSTGLLELLARIPDPEI